MGNKPSIDRQAVQGKTEPINTWKSFDEGGPEKERIGKMSKKDRMVKYTVKEGCGSFDGDVKPDTTFDSDSRRGRSNTSANGETYVDGDRHAEVKLSPGRGSKHTSKAVEFKAAVGLIGERQKDHISNLKHMKEQMIMRGKKKDDKKKPHIDTTNTDYTNSYVEKTILNFSDKEPKSKPVNFHTFYEANMFGFKLYQEGAYRQFQCTLNNIREESFNKSVTWHYSEANIMFETVFNYKLDAYLIEDGFPILTVFSLPESMKLNQKKIRLLALKSELVKFMRADPMLKEIDFSGVVNIKKSKEDEDSTSDIEVKTNFFDKFKIVIISEIGFNSVVISRSDIKTGAQLSDHSTLVCPDVTSFQLKKVESLDLQFEEVMTVMLNNDSAAFDYFRLRCTNGTDYMIKTLHMNTLMQSWNPIFYMLQELRIYSNHLYHRHHYSNILSFEDYFLTAHSAEKFSTMCFIYEDFDCTLRDIISDRQKSKIHFTVAEIVQIFMDVLKGLCALHKLGVVHRNLKPENIVYSKKKSKFMIANLSLALVFNKEEAMCSSYDLVGTPFYMAIDMFSDLVVDQNRLRFTHDPFKADVYSIGIMMIECLWINIETSESDMVQLKKAFIQSELKSLDDLLELCELKHREHNLFLSIFRKKPSAFKKLADYDMFKGVLENLVFEEANARYNAYQAKNALSRMSSGEVSAQAFNVDTIKKKNTLDFSIADNISSVSLFLCLKNSLFLKDLNLGDQAEAIDQAIEKLWTPPMIETYKEDYIQFIIARIKNLARMRKIDRTLQILEEQSKLYQDKLNDPLYCKLALECLTIKNDIMFIRNSVDDFVQANFQCESLVKNISTRQTLTESLSITWKLMYSDIVMNFWLFNEKGDKSCIRALDMLLTQIKSRVNFAQVDPNILINSILMNAILKPTDYDAKLRLLKDLEDKITTANKDNYECLAQIFLFQVYYLALQGNNIPAFDYSKKVVKIISGNFEDRPIFEIISQLAPIIAAVNSDNDEYGPKVAGLIRYFGKLVKKESNSTILCVCIFFLAKLGDHFCSTEELKQIYKYHLDLLHQLIDNQEMGPLVRVRPSIDLMELYVRDLQYDQAFKILDKIKGSLATIETYCEDIERLYWILQLQPRMLFEQGMYYEARLQLEDLTVKIKAESIRGKFDSFMLARIHTEVSYLLMTCYIKMRHFEPALAMARQLLSQCDYSIDDLGLRIKVVMGCVKVLLNVDSNLVKDVDIVKHVNRVTEEVKNTTDAMARIDILYFLAFHVYLKLRKIKKAMAALDDNMITKLLSKEHTRKNQISIRLYMKRKQLKMCLKIWNYTRRDQKVVERILKLVQSIVKKLSISPSPYEKETIIKSFTIVSQAYLSLGLLDESLINLSKAIVSMNTFNVSGSLLLHSEVYLLFSKVLFMKHRTSEAYETVKTVLQEYKTFFGENSIRTKKVYQLMQRICSEDEEWIDEGKHYADTEPDDNLSESEEPPRDELDKTPVRQKHNGDLLMLPGHRGNDLKDLAMSDAGDDIFMPATPSNYSPAHGLRENGKNCKISYELEPSQDLDPSKKSSLGLP